MKTRYQRLSEQLAKAEHAIYALEKEKEVCQIELDNYVRKHRSLKFDGLEEWDRNKLSKIYEFLDKSYKVEWEGGLRLDTRGMKLCYWVHDDPDYLIIHLTSTTGTLVFSGSTSWIVKAKTLAEKVAVLKNVKARVLAIINRKV